jgi:hypothetical protein
VHHFARSLLRLANSTSRKSLLVRLTSLSQVSFPNFPSIQTIPSNTSTSDAETAVVLVCLGYGISYE